VNAGGSGPTDESTPSDEPPAVPGPVPAVLLCGGAGTRLGGDVEKPLVEVGGTPMVDRVLDAVHAADAVGRVHAVASPDAPATAAHLHDRAAAADEPLSVHEGAGAGYVADLDAALDRVDTPAVTVAADLPLLSPDVVDQAVDRAVDRAGGDSLSVCVPVAVKRALGVSADTTFVHDGTPVAPTGLNVVGDGSDRVTVREREALAVNVNRPDDLAVARDLAAGDGSAEG